MINTDNNPYFLNSFLDYIETILNKSPNTIKEYNYDIGNFLRFLLKHYHLTDEKEYKNIVIRDMDIAILKHVKLEDLHAYLAYLTRVHQSKAATRARKVASLKTFFHYLTTKTNWLEINPAQNLESPKLDKRVPKYLSLDDSKKLLNAVSNKDENARNKVRDYAIITLFLNCGMRLSELVNLNIKDISFEDEKLNVIGKGNKERTIYLNRACMDAIQSYLKVRPKERIKPSDIDALFLSERNERIRQRTVQYIVKRELRNAGLDTQKYSTHKLRHTAATLMYKYGNVDIRALQELLGHESISTTEIYTHVDNTQIRSAVESNPLANVHPE